MKSHDREKCRQRRERPPDWEAFDHELAHDLDGAPDREAQFFAAWLCFLRGPCSKGPTNEDQ